MRKAPGDLLANRAIARGRRTEVALEPMRLGDPVEPNQWRPSDAIQDIVENELSIARCGGHNGLNGI